MSPKGYFLTSYLHNDDLDNTVLFKTLVGVTFKIQVLK